MKRITVKQARELLQDIATYVHISKFETGNRTNLKRDNSVCHYAYNEYKDICKNNTKLAVIAHVNIYRVFKPCNYDTYISLVNNRNKYLIRFDENVKFYYNEINGCQFLIVTDNRECNVFQLFRVSLPEAKQYTDSEIENMYNELQTGNTVQLETKIGTLSANVMTPGNFAICIQGHISFAIPNRFENFYDYIKKYTV